MEALPPEESGNRKFKKKAVTGQMQIHRIFLFTVSVSRQVVLKVEGKVHSATLRDVQLSEAGQVKLTAKDFQAEATLTVRGKTPSLASEPPQVLSTDPAQTSKASSYTIDVEMEDETT